MKFLCLRCWNSGVVKERERIPKSELSAIDRAELLVNGGYAYRIVKRSCSCGRNSRQLNPIRYMPVFSGKTKDEERIVLYKSVNNESELHIRCPDGGLWMLSSDRQIEIAFDPIESKLYISVQSPEWTGTAKGTKRDLIEEEALK